MAKAHIYISVNGNIVRCVGGNTSYIRNEYNKYINMKKEDFIKEHPKMQKEIEINGFFLEIYGTKNIIK